jgi:hypothetical protein
MTGIKHDGPRLRWSLLPWDAIEVVVQLLEYGARKYPAANNWQHVENAEQRYLDALTRHLVEVHKGNYYDDGPEGSGFPHFAAIATNALFLLWFWLRRGGVADKSK